MKNTTVELKQYNYDTNENEDKGTVSTYLLAKNMTLENFTAFLSDFLNLGGKDYHVGHKIGVLEQSDHRTLQGMLVRFCLGIIIGISEQDYTDARNEKVVELGKKVAQMIESGELNMGYMI